MDTLFAGQEATESTCLPDAVKALTITARQKFVHIALVSDVEDKPIAGRIKNSVES